MRGPETDRPLTGSRAPVFPPAFLLLFFGDDHGLVKEWARAAVSQRAADPADPFSVARLSSDRLACDPSLLMDEAMTLSLSDRTIWIEAAGTQTIAGLETLLAAPPPNVCVVVEAGDLRRDSPLRRLCEASKQAHVVECRSACSESDFAAELARNDLTIDEDAREALFAHLPSDFLSRQGEIEKLQYFALGRDRIRLSDVQAVTAGAKDVSSEMAMEAALAGDMDRFAADWARGTELGLDASVLAGYALRSLLFRVTSSSYRRSESIEPDLGRAGIRLLFSAVRLGRMEPRLSALLACRAFWSLANQARRRRSQA